nr:type II toxin-antitoxin system PemK/MazF family toxin [Chamaesiphon sp. VAR_69_metabat_338]
MLPRRGEIWLVNLDPTVGAEIQKTRPAIVISSDYIGKLPLKLVVERFFLIGSLAYSARSYQ